jgi:AcrR family transcriptional regulator
MAKTRDRILAAAERIHQREGLESVSMRRIADEVGLTAMALYRHFRHKEALLDALVDEGFVRWERYLAAAATAPTPVERVRGGLTAYVGFALGEPKLFQLMYLVPRGSAPDAPASPASLRTTTSPAFGALVSAVQEAMAAGELRAGDPSELLLVAWATVHGIVTLHFGGRFGNDDARFRAIAGRTIETLLLMLAPPSAGPLRRSAVRAAP